MAANDGEKSQDLPLRPLSALGYRRRLLPRWSGLAFARRRAFRGRARGEKPLGVETLS
jgi:hypothetical protein